MRFEVADAGGYDGRDFDLIAFFDEHVDVVRVDGKPNEKPATKWSKK